VIENNFISTPNSRLLDLSPIRLGTAKMRAECNKQRNRLRKASQPLAWGSDSPLRWSWRRDRDARPHWRFQWVV